MKMIDTLIGIPVSIGNAEGFAQVIIDPSQDFEKDILVVKETNPDYTPHLYASKGVIGEVGGMLNHLAIVSREAKIPSISGVKDATLRIVDGDYVYLDAKSGIIKIEKKPFVSLADAGATSVFRFGGKAKGLNVLMSNNFNVPNGLALDWQIRELLRKEEIEELVSSMGLDEKISYAIRSSAVSEDSMNKSYAGQYLTFLNVCYKEIPDKLIQIINAKPKRAEAYSDNNLDLRVGCIVQQYLEAEKSGVIFTKNPLTGNENEIVIEAVKGEGELLVSGRMTPSSYIINLTDPSEAHIFNENILDSDTISKLIRDSSKIKKILGKNVDIEFCIKDGNIYYLQARPITT